MADKLQRLQQITLWLTKLALLTSGGKTPVTKQQIGLYATIFSDEVPVGAFSDESLTAICGSCEFFPAYAVLKTALMAWWEAQEASRNPPARVERSSSFQEYLDEMFNNEAHQARMVERSAAITRSWQPPWAVRDAVGKVERDAAPGFQLLLGRLLWTIVARHAPENLGFVPPEYHPVEGRQ